MSSSTRKDRWHHRVQRPEADGWWSKIARPGAMEWLHPGIRWRYRADDSPLSHEILAKILPVVRYYSYIELRGVRIRPVVRIQHLQSMFDNFAIQHIRDQDISIRCSVNCPINKVRQQQVNQYKSAS